MLPNDAERKAMTVAAVDRRFTYQPPSSDGVKRAHELVGHVTRYAAHALARFLPDSRELSQALSSLELCRMQANQAVALAQHEVSKAQLEHVQCWLSAAVTSNTIEHAESAPVLDATAPEAVVPPAPLSTPAESPL